MFVKALIVRVDLRDTPTWRQLLARVECETREAITYADVPFNTLAARLDAQRDLKRPPVTSVYVNAFEGVAVLPDFGPGIIVSEIPLPDIRVKYDIEFTFRSTPEHVRLEVAYATSLFGREEIDGLHALLMDSARALAAQPDRPALWTFSDEVDNPRSAQTCEA
jgi:hypothetical protein